MRDRVCIKNWSTVQSETRLKKIAAFAFSGSVQCNKSLDFLTDELEKMDDVQQKFDELSNELDVRTQILELQLSGKDRFIHDLRIVPI